VPAGEGFAEGLPFFVMGLGLVSPPTKTSRWKRSGKVSPALKFKDGTSEERAFRTY